MSQLTFRSITEADLESVLFIESQVHYSPWKVDSFQRCISGRYQGWIVTSNSQLCGYVVVSSVAGEAEILNVSVAKNMQGQGVGSKLIEQVISELKPSCDNIFLEVRESNHSAIALYEKYYFCELGRRNNYYPAKKGREDALIYGLTL